MLINEIYEKTINIKQTIYFFGCTLKTKLNYVDIIWSVQII